MGTRCHGGVRTYRWPLLCVRVGVAQERWFIDGNEVSWRGADVPVASSLCPCGGGSGSLDPGDVASEPLAEIDGSLIQGQLGSSSPQFEGIAVAVTTMAVVAAARHVDGEAAFFTFGRRVMQGTAAVPLGARARCGLEAEQVEHLGHGDLGAEAVEV